MSLQLVEASNTLNILLNERTSFEAAEKQFVAAYRKLVRKYADAVKALGTLLERYGGSAKNTYKLLAVNLPKKPPFEIETEEEEFDFASADVQSDRVIIRLERGGKLMWWGMFYMKHIDSSDDEIIYHGTITSATKETLEAILTLFNTVTFTSIIAYLQERLQHYNAAAITLETLVSQPAIPATRIKALTQF